jgi:hypothetical protein
MHPDHLHEPTFRPPTEGPSALPEATRGAASYG